jgi:hypothetical protein
MNTPSIAAIDLVELESRLEALMAGYAGALKYVEHLPRLGRVTVAPDEANRLAQQLSHSPRKVSRVLYRVWYPGRRWVARSFVRLFVESHIRAKLETILRYLRIELSACVKGAESNPRAKQLEFYIKQIDLHKSTLFKWRLLGALIVKAPWLPVVIAFATPLLAQATGIDLSSVDQAVQSTILALQSSESLQMLGQLGLLVLVLYAVLSPLPAQLGFVPKRAIFSGGKTVRGVYDRPEFMRWIGFPGLNLYHLETQVFETIGVPKPRELPLDFVMTLTPFYVFALTLFISAASIQSILSGIALTSNTVFWLIACWILTIGRLRDAQHNFRLRTQQGDM